MTGIQFKDFPVSFRLAQWGMLVTLFAMFASRRILTAPNAVGFRRSLLIVIGGVFLVAVISTYYVVIRYPFLGLVDATDGDLFHRHIAARKLIRATLRVVNYIAIGALIWFNWILLSQGNITFGKLLFSLYTLTLVGFLVFLAVRYDRSLHPTIATLIRASLGFGVLLFPLFLPAIILGSVRCRLLLDFADANIRKS